MAVLLNNRVQVRDQQMQTGGLEWGWEEQNPRSSPPAAQVASRGEPKRCQCLSVPAGQGSVAGAGTGQSPGSSAQCLAEGESAHQ